MPPSRFPAILADLRHAGLEVFADVAFPEPQHEPAELRELVAHVAIALDIPRQVFSPVILIGTHLFAGMFLMPPRMPEIAIDEHGNLALRDGDVRLAGQSVVVLPIADALVPERLAEDNLGACVSGMNMAHGAMTLFLREDVHMSSSHFENVETHAAIPKITSIHLLRGEHPYLDVVQAQRLHHIHPDISLVDDLVFFGRQEETVEEP